MTYPTPDLEISLLNQVDFLIGVDEVGRGAIAGPVAVGACLVGLAQLDLWPSQIRDSKLLSERTRVEVAPLIRAWAPCEVGLASASEIETVGITRALSLAAKRAIQDLVARAIPKGKSACVLLDGTHNWLEGVLDMPVRVEKKADQTCVSVAAASVVAKVHRDALMVDMSSINPGYGLESNKGYASEAHITALRNLGPSAQHRVSWLAKILADGQLF